MSIPYRKLLLCDLVCLICAVGIASSCKARQSQYPHSKHERFSHNANTSYKGHTRHFSHKEYKVAT